ncbi:hypothetical protein ACIQ62_34330 [Streptomyces sp. NPDC096319]|uniref:hypothetical protein n=1 Tax=Streptomyces sp. NPDC096319 TaxID=3366084 RepID=UPI003824B9BD
MSPLSELTGYIERGLDQDLARWFPDAPPVSMPTPPRPVDPFLARLPRDAATALAAFDRKVRSGTMRQCLDVYEWTYGFDFATNDCTVLDSDYATELGDDDVWSLGADGGGNLYVMRTDGRVAVWFHEEQVLEDGTDFDNLDVFVWSAVRYRAVRAGVLDLAAVEADFRSLAQPGVLAPEIGLLASMS